jgi:hypothetical protein
MEKAAFEKGLCNWRGEKDQRVMEWKLQKVRLHSQTYNQNPTHGG